jgi:hypothetical protein
MRPVLKKVCDYYRNPLDYAEVRTAHITPYGKLEMRMRSLAQIIGADYIGSGNFARVYPLNSRWVLKITSNNRDDGYDAYAKFCMTFQHNPYVPRILARVEVTRDVRLYILERLNALNRIPDYDRANHLRSALNKGEHDCPHYTELMKAFGTKNFTDLHERNVMKRDDGQLVITDPCHFFTGLGAMRHAPEPRRMTDEWRVRARWSVPLPPVDWIAPRNLPPFMRAEIEADRVPRAIKDLLAHKQEAVRYAGHRHLIERNERDVRRCRRVR